MSKTKLRRQSRDEPALRADQRHADISHAANITPSDIDPSTVSPHQMPNTTDIDTDSPDDQEVDLATRIRRARLQAKLTQLEVALRLGVRQSAVSQWERGRVEPELATRIKLAELLNIPIAQILPEVGEVPDSAFTDPHVRRLIAAFVSLPEDERLAYELILLRRAEQMRRR